MTPKTDIVLFTDSTPNGQKVSVVLEELGLKYEMKHVDISKGTQKEGWFLKINPNGRIPAIVDRTPKADGKEQEKRVFEGGAILLYLCQKYDPAGKLSYPYDSDEHWEIVEWIMWMQSGLGPMQGQSNHFYRYAPEKIEYGINRYKTETKRLYSVIEARLVQQKISQKASSSPWIVGDKITIADLACFSWVNWAEWAGIYLQREDGTNFLELKDWLERINSREAVKRGLDVPKPFTLKEKWQTKEGEEEYAKHHSNWIMEGQKENHETHK
ncbi:glutathione S-transferase [Amylocarpus encephaloides]|uniref:Glutathione S-transferase n=1 Tax=Amylocarpus encephaloides TaxID=45428 RepID=A0A9P7YQJ4_9HELO|nr:glutathione S-transferase [Amylocarpus encephaloides]